MGKKKGNKVAGASQPKGWTNPSAKNASGTCPSGSKRKAVEVENSESPQPRSDRLGSASESRPRLAELGQSPASVPIKRGRAASARRRITVLPGQCAHLEGLAVVRLAQGRATALGYDLRPGEDLMLASASCLSAPTTIEPAMPWDHGADDDPDAFGLLGVGDDDHAFGSLGAAAVGGAAAYDVTTPSGARANFGGPSAGAGEEASVILEVEMSDVRELVRVSATPPPQAVGASPGAGSGGMAGGGGGGGGSGDLALDTLATDTVGADAPRAGKGRASAANGIEGRHFKLLVKPVSECKGRFVLTPAWRSAVAQAINILARPHPVNALARAPLSAPQYEHKHGTEGGWPPLCSLAITGPKNAGKSTMARLVVNQLLNRFPLVAFLDTDIGQPEFTPAGVVSLHLLDAPVFGPPAMHQRPPYRSYFIGDVSPKSDPEHYIRCVCALYDHVWDYASASHLGRAGHAAGTRQVATATWSSGSPSDDPAHRGGGSNAQPSGGSNAHRGGGLPTRQSSGTGGSIPLVVNTHGWVKGVGYELLIEVLRYIRPSVVIQLESSSIGRNLPADDGRFWELPGGVASGAADPASLLFPPENNGRSVVIRLPAAKAMEEDSTTAPPSAATSAQEARAYQWLAYLERGWRSVHAGLLLPTVTLQAAFSLGATALACLQPYAVSLRAVRVVSLFAELVGLELMVALNGALVGLASSKAFLQQVGVAAGGSMPLPCLGQALVRSIDMKEQVLYLLCPLPLEQLQAVDVLLLGRLETPAQLLKGDSCLSPYLSGDCLSQAGSGSATMKSRNNLQFRTYL